MGELRVGGVTDVVVGRGNATAEIVLADHGATRVALVTQPAPAATVAHTLAASLVAAGREASIFEVPDGDLAKTMPVVDSLCAQFSDAGLTRDDLVIGVGGGAATDLAGFTAAVYLRGVDVHYVPTTLLGAVDASIGGKTGVNAAGKNIIGAFRHPRRVVIDLDVLDALPIAVRRQGAAEALKTGLIGDPALVDLFETHGLEAPLDEVVPRSLAVKAAVVTRDFEEMGERAHLNYGHTVGHAIEFAGRIPHGEAVAIGMVAAGRASALVAGFGEEQRQRSIITGLGLPIMAPDLDLGTIHTLIGRDKKRRGERVRMVLLEAVGSPFVTEVETATVRAALAAVGIEGEGP